MPWTSAQTRSQFAAIANLRWRVTVNSLRRKGGAGELIARILIYPLFAFLALIPTVGIGAGAFLIAHFDKLQHLSWLLWGTFAFCQLLNINLGQPGTTFDPTQLIRFPMRLGNYVAIRLFFGLLTPANVIGTLMCFYAFLGLAVFAAANVLFSRMVFAWVDRWLSTRRAREVFTALIFAFSMGVQFVNFAVNPAYNRGRHQHSHLITQARAQFILNAYHHAAPVMAALPPGLTSASIIAASQQRHTAFLADTLACAAFAAVFLLTFAWRMRTEFRGENLSNVANAVSGKAAGSRAVPSFPSAPEDSRFQGAGLQPRRNDSVTTGSHSSPALKGTGFSPSVSPAKTIGASAPEGRPAGLTGFFRHSLPPIVPAILAKEFLYVRRNTGVFYSMVAPIVMVFLFSMRMSARGSGAWLFPAALGYTLLGIAPLSYNSFGLEATGAQLYFMAPVRLRDVVLAKNLMNFLLAFAEVVAVFLILTFISTMPPLLSVATGLLWAAATLLLSTSLGNRRSISAPKKVDLTRMSRKQASGLSGLISMGILLGSAAVGALVLLGARLLHLPWLPLPIMAAYAAVGFFVYTRSLTTIDSFALDHRDELFEELCKK
jgi:ABC-2 type transport system permease protein